MGPLGSVSLIVAAAVVALLVNLTGLATPDGGPGERRALERRETSVPPPSARWWDEGWRRAFDETTNGPRASLAETLIAVASGDLLPTVPGENVVDEVRTLARDGVTAGIDSVSAAGPLSSPRLPGEDDVLSGAPGPGGPTSPSSPVPSSPSDPSSPAPSDPPPTDPTPSDPDPTDPAPTDPGPSDPPPSDPDPTDPAPTDPAPSDPPPDPDPTDPPPPDPDPEPSEPPPSDPPPEPDPEPSDPPPSDPADTPTDPSPTDPAP
ncbi:MAG TPA: hypothetical protein VFZ64_15435 [Nocardioidaceae bacterium]